MKTPLARLRAGAHRSRRERGDATGGGVRDAEDDDGVVVARTDELTMVDAEELASSRVVKQTTPLRAIPPVGTTRGMMNPAASSSSSSSSSRVEVVIRIRPALRRELEGSVAYQKAIVRTDQGKTCVASESAERTLGRRMMMGDVVSDGGVGTSGSMLEDGDFDSASTRFKSHEFGFDAVYDEISTQKEVYERSAKPAVLNALRGYNATVLAYGQTGTGKTYTMEGERSALLAYGQQRYGLPGNAPPTDAEERGIIPRAIEDIFDFIASDSNARSKYLVRVSYLQIYNETISDLLKPERVNLTIREDKKRGVFVEGQSEWVARTPQEIYSLLERGAQLRATGSTKMNEISSRSHAVFTIIIEHSKIDDDEPVDAIDSGAMTRAQRQSVTVGKLNLVDLAGSERVSLTGATGKRLDESKKINQSLSALGNVISALTDVKGRPHIPYRDSKLTRILEDSLGGNCITTVIATVSPALEAYAESLSTLKFANRAKEIKNKAKLNEDLDQKSLLRKYERELRQLRSELDERTRDLVDKRRLLEVDEQRRKAEADKLRAITELEMRSKEFLVEKQEKRDLEKRITELQSQLLGGDDPQSIAAVRAEYERKLKSIEAEREGDEVSAREMERYKAVLLKQRDIMLGLTSRLRERDDKIQDLQNQIVASEEQKLALEDALDVKTAELLGLKRAAVKETLNAQLSGSLRAALGGWAGSESESEGGSADPKSVGATDLVRQMTILEKQAKQNRDALQEVEADNARLRLELLTSERRNDVTSKLEHLEAKCASYERERSAIRTIIDSKISSLATKIADAVDTLPPAVKENAEQGGRIVRLSQVLERLIDATLVALDEDDKAKRGA